MLRKIKGISRIGIIFRPIQWMWIQRWPLLVIVAPVVAGTIFYFIDDYLAPERAIHPTDKFLQEKQIAQVKKDVLQITSQILVGITVLSGAYFTWKRLEVSREDQITDRYTRAIDQLGSENLEIRLGGIYALERLAKDSRKDQETVMEVLTAFVRENASLQKSEKIRLSESSDEDSYVAIEKEEKIPEKITPNTDIQEILTVIGRRKWKVTGKIDLRGADLRGADLSWANLRGADLRKVDLIEANLREADMYKANLSGANLRGAYLYEVDLRGASLFRANLHSSYLLEANLHDAYLLEANLSEASLLQANLHSADLRGVLAITPDQIMKAKCWENALYSDDFKAQLGLSTEPKATQEKSEEQPLPQN